MSLVEQTHRQRQTARLGQLTAREAAEKTLQRGQGALAAGALSQPVATTSSVATLSPINYEAGDRFEVAA